MRCFVHVFNRGVDRREIFLSEGDYSRFLLSLWLSNFEESLKPSELLNFLKEKDEKGEELDLRGILSTFGPPFVDIVSFCLMPNHYHLMLSFKYTLKEAVSPFMQRLDNSYAHYFNVKNNRTGRLFSGPFKRVEVESESQFKHLSRYIHCNPANSEKLNYDARNLRGYPFSSLPLYCGEDLGFNFGKGSKLTLNLSDICRPDDVLSHFRSGRSYWEFCRWGIENEVEPSLGSNMLLDYDGPVL